MFSHSMDEISQDKHSERQGNNHNAKPWSTPGSLIRKENMLLRSGMTPW